MTLRGYAVRDRTVLKLVKEPLGSPLFYLLLISCYTPDGERAPQHHRRLISKCVGLELSCGVIS